MLFVGDDWAEDHHDVYLMNETGKKLAVQRFPEGLIWGSGCQVGRVKRRP